MDTPMLKRRLNPFLLVSTVLILSLLAGLSVFYQGQLNNLVTSKKDLKQDIQAKEAKIEELKTEKSNATRQLRQKNDRITALKSLLQSKREEVDQLSSRVSELEDRIEELRNQTSSSTEEVNSTLGFICADSKTSLSEDAVTLCKSEGHDTS